MPATATPGIERAKYLWEPQEGPQKVFYNSRVDEVFYGGSAGGGKSDGLLGVSLQQIGHPKYRALILRRTLKQLKKAEGLIDKCHSLLHGIAKPNMEDNTFTFATGARLDFGYCDSDKDVYQYQGSGYSVICFDELTHFSEFQYKTIQGFCRTIYPGLRKMIRSASNPGSLGHAWVKRRFIDAMAPYEIVRGRNGLTRQYIPARVADNKILMERDPDYIKRLEGLPEPWRTALLFGDWNIFVGQAFPEWSFDKHSCDAFEMPYWWPRLISVDWGYSSHACATSMCQSDEPRIYPYRELYTTGVEAKPFAQRLIDNHALPGGQMENVRTVVLDRACFGQRGDPKTIAEQMQEEFHKVGWTVQPSDSKDRIGRKMLIHEYLRLNPLKKVEPRPPVDDYWSERFRLEGQKAVQEYESLGIEEVLPKMKIFRPTPDGRYGCPNLLRTMPTLVLDENKVEDVDTNQEDHPYDSLGYGLREFSYKTPDKPREIILQERLRGADRSTLHIGRAAAEKELRRELTEGQPDRIFYRQRPY